MEPYNLRSSAPQSMELESTPSETDTEGMERLNTLISSISSFIQKSNARPLRSKAATSKYRSEQSHIKKLLSENNLSSDLSIRSLQAIVTRLHAEKEHPQILQSLGKRSRPVQEREKKPVRAQQNPFIRTIQELKRRLSTASDTNELLQLFKEAEELEQQSEDSPTSVALIKSFLSEAKIIRHITTLLNKNLFTVPPGYSKKNLQKFYIRHLDLTPLGRGTFKIVNKLALQTLFGKIKIYAFAELSLPSEENIRNLVNECALSLKLRRANVPYTLKMRQIFYDIGTAQKIGALCELCSQGSLESYIKEHPTLDAAERMALLKQLVSALDGMHTAGYCHLDLKSANVLLKTVNDHLEIRLADFGTTKETAQMTWACGTYNPPELYGQENDSLEATPSIDQWALGNTIVEVLYGRNILLELGLDNGHSQEEFNRKLRQLPKTLQRIMPPLQQQNALEKLIPALFSRDPARRPTASDLKNALAECH